MVLKRMLLWVAVCALACVPRTPIVRAVTPMTVAVAYVVDYDDERAPGDVPDELRAAVTGVLKQRNLAAADVSFAQYQPRFANKPSTTQRLTELERLAGGAPLLLLVETKASYYSQINGRYRWTVLVKITWAQTGKLAGAGTRSFDMPAVLDFDHEKEPAAVRSGARTIAGRVAREADVFLQGLDVATTRVAVAPGSREQNFDAIYFVMVDRFDNGDKSNDDTVNVNDPNAFHGGDLRGVINRLDYVRDLGFRTIWLSPVFAMRTKKFHGHGAFHGYWTRDLAKVEPRFGSLADLQELVAEAHKRDMRIVLDMVLNHVSFDAPLLTEHPEWFHHNGPITDWNDKRQLEDYQVHGLPDLAQEREDVYQFLLARSLSWVSATHVDGFRLDAVKHVPAKFWRRYLREMRAQTAADFVLLGEVYDGNAQSLAVSQRSTGFRSLFDFPLYFAAIDVFCKGKPLGRLADVMFADRNYVDADRMVTLLDNHDLPRLMSSCNGNLDAVKQALAFQMTMRGTPAMTYGTESGMLGEQEPDNRRDMRFVDHPLANTTRKLLTLRRAHSSLRGGRTRLLTVADELLVYMRATHKEALVVAVNRGAKSAHTSWPTGLAKKLRAEDLLAQRPLPSDGMSIAPNSIRLAMLTAADGSPLRMIDRDKPNRPIKVRVADAPSGQLLLIGSGKELGQWQPDHAVRFVKEKGVHVHSMTLPTGAALAYKLAVRQNDGTVTWESGENRTLFVEDARGVKVVALTWRK